MSRRDLADVMAEEMGRGQRNVFELFEETRGHSRRFGIYRTRDTEYYRRRRQRQNEAIRLLRLEREAQLARAGWHVGVAHIAADLALYARRGFTGHLARRARLQAQYGERAA